MTSINEKLGIKRAGKRAFMNLPDNPAERVSLTAATCPRCERTGVRENVIHKKRQRLCSWCGHVWDSEAV